MESKSNILDRTIGFFSPEAELRRMVARQKMEYFRYEGAQISRARGSASRLEHSESSYLSTDRIQLIREIQDLMQNFPLVKSILLKMVAYVFGSLDYQARTGDRETNKLYEDYLRTWFANADVTGRHTFRELCSLALMSTVGDGDCGFIYVKSGKTIQLQGIESVRIGNPYEISDSDPFYINGIFLNTAGRPTRYRIYEVSRQGVWGEHQDVGASNFCHIFSPFRMDQYRGVTAFHASIATMRDIHEILKAEKQAVKFAACQTAIARTSSGAAEFGENYFNTDSQDANSNTIRLEAIEGGRINYVGDADDLKIFESNRPSPSFQGFLQLLYRDVALSLGLPYGFVYDLATLGGPTARLDSAQAQRVFQSWQKVMEDKFLNRTKNLVLAKAIDARELPWPKNKNNWSKGMWQFPAHPTIDVGRESAAGINENKAGLMSKAKWFGEQGLDYESEAEQIEREAKDTIERAQRISEETGVEFETVMNLLEIRTANGMQPVQEADAQNSKSKGLSFRKLMRNGHIR